MTERDGEITAFLSAQGWGRAGRAHLAGDASFRRYERLHQDGAVRVLMDAPPDKEDVRPFVALSAHLSALGYSAPENYAADMASGLLLLEDFGDLTYTRALEAGADETALYTAAVDLLIDLHNRPQGESVPDGLAPYDAGRLMAEAALLPQWYLRDRIGADAEEAYRQIWAELFRLLENIPPTLVLRDFHADNLFWLPDRPALRVCGLIDYQDAVAGPPAYDLMSLLQDARRDLAPGLEEILLDRYRAQRDGIDWPQFETSYRLLAAQRHCKVIGIFTRLAVRDGKDEYLRHIGRVRGMLAAACEAPFLAPLRDWLALHLPPVSERA